MSKSKRNKELFEKGFISEEALREIDMDMYEILVAKNKKELAQTQKEFEKVYRKAKGF